LQLQEVGGFEALNCLPPQNLTRSTKLHLTTQPPIFEGIVSGLPFLRSMVCCIVFAVALRVWAGIFFFELWALRWLVWLANVFELGRVGISSSILNF
jgi:hypothetical protein